MTRPTSGFQLVELLVVATLLLLVALLTAPPLLRASSRLRVRLAASELRATLFAARSFAVRHSAKVAVKFYPAAELTEYALFRDGDGDGVRNADIEAGVDPQVWPRRPLSNLGRGVGFGFPPGIAPRDPSDPHRRLDRLDDPIRFNRSDLASYSHLGTATPGTLYLTDGRRLLVAVRVVNRTGRVRTLTYDSDREVWEE